MQRGRVFERLGRDREAIENYEFVAAAWRTADPELQPYVRESREAIARIKTRSKQRAVSGVATKEVTDQPPTN